MERLSAAPSDQLLAGTLLWDFFFWSTLNSTHLWYASEHPGWLFQVTPFFRVLENVTSETSEIKEIQTHLEGFIRCIYGVNSNILGHIVLQLWPALKFWWNRIQPPRLWLCKSLHFSHSGAPFPVQADFSYNQSIFTVLLNGLYAVFFGGQQTSTSA